MDPTFILLYVADPVVSVNFYTALFERSPVESSANFAMFSLGSGMMLGLWAQKDVLPASGLSGGGGELAFAVDSNAGVDACHQRWIRAGRAIAQEPVAMDFGYTFTATDPDGHRLRVFHPAAP